ncbi:hypothetical protein EYF80_063622 [Liparis tanakae]|uniref:Uncharacterized protein n=1 Tax=Liparis tanakae TaxID=230148 RepID=A0A4Z2ED77_9TELE|nr:hypothetical protein EYF80_063622 [Liparis tanakae]
MSRASTRNPAAARAGIYHRVRGQGSGVTLTHSGRGHCAAWLLGGVTWYLQEYQLSGKPWHRTTEVTRGGPHLDPGEEGQPVQGVVQVVHQDGLHPGPPCGLHSFLLRVQPHGLQRQERHAEHTLSTRRAHAKHTPLYAHGHRPLRVSTCRDVTPSCCRAQLNMAGSGTLWPERQDWRTRSKLAPSRERRRAGAPAEGASSSQ